MNRSWSTSACSPSISARTAASTSIANYGMQDGKVFDFISRTTPTGGKDQNFLGQMLAGAGKMPADLLGGGNARKGRRPATDRPAHARRAVLEKTKARGIAPAGFLFAAVADAQPCASTASSSSATMLVILIAGLTAGPAVSL